MHARTLRYHANVSRQFRDSSQRFCESIRKPIANSSHPSEIGALLNLRRLKRDKPILLIDFHMQGQMYLYNKASFYKARLGPLIRLNTIFNLNVSYRKYFFRKFLSQISPIVDVQILYAKKGKCVNKKIFYTL